MIHSTRDLAVLVFVIAVALGSAGTAAAHETVTVDGYEVTFGGADEPVITGERMWLQVEVLDARTGEPVVGIEDAVEMAVQRPFGNDTFELDVGAVHGRPGWYEGAIVFTEPGTYTVYVTAEIDGEPIETSFSKQVHNASTLRYPPPTDVAAPAAGMDAGAGFALGALVVAAGMVGAFVIGRRS